MRRIATGQTRRPIARVRGSFVVPTFIAFLLHLPELKLSQHAADSRPAGAAATFLAVADELLQALAGIDFGR